MKREQLDAQLVELHGGDPFAHVIAAAARHRRAHGPACGLYPAGRRVMRLAATIASAVGAKRALDLGTGFGYSALWLATSGTRVEAIDQFQEHVAAAAEFAAEARLADRVQFIHGDVEQVLHGLDGDYDLIHDDAWFGAAPNYLERIIALLRPGGALSMPSWFLLTDALKGVRHQRWARWAGPRWEESTLAYARRLASDPRLQVTWTVSPPLGIAIKR